VVINNDPEAPFFSLLIMELLGDAFDVVPRLMRNLKNLNCSNHNVIFFIIAA
jgi:electron transfer flavoprotein alpha subunit